jgi:hypothetical protein
MIEATSEPIKAHFNPILDYIRGSSTGNKSFFVKILNDADTIYEMMLNSEKHLEAEYCGVVDHLVLNVANADCEYPLRKRWKMLHELRIKQGVTAKYLYSLRSIDRCLARNLIDANEAIVLLNELVKALLLLPKLHIALCDNSPCIQGLLIWDDKRAMILSPRDCPRQLFENAIYVEGKPIVKLLKTLFDRSFNEVREKNLRQLFARHPEMLTPSQTFDEWFSVADEQEIEKDLKDLTISSLQQLRVAIKNSFFPTDPIKKGVEGL